MAGPMESCGRVSMILNRRKRSVRAMILGLSAPNDSAPHAIGIRAVCRGRDRSVDIRSDTRILIPTTGQIVYLNRCNRFDLSTRNLLVRDLVCSVRRFVLEYSCPGRGCVGAGAMGTRSPGALETVVRAQIMSGLIEV